MMRWSAIWLLVGPARTRSSEIILPAITFAITTAAVLSTAVLATLYWRVPDETGVYKILAAALVTMLLVPLSTLAASGARLSARRRQDRLATLRLLGATSRWVRLVAVTDSTLVASLGVVAGIIMHIASAPLLIFVPVRSTHPTIDQVWMSGPATAAIALSIIAIAAMSAVSGLRRVVISPLGVRTRVSAPKLSWARVVIAGLVIAAAILLVQMASADWGITGITLAFALAVLAVMAVLGVAGPFVVGRLAMRRARRANSAAAVIAARGILESPGSAWRQVSGVALASFLVLPTGAILGYFDLIERSSTVVDSAISQVFTDIRTVMLLAVVITFLLVACSVGVTQATAIIERRELYISLNRIGMPLVEMNRARRLAVLWPLGVAAFGSAIAATLLGVGFVATMIVMAPWYMAGAIAAIVGGAAIVVASIFATTPVLVDALEHPDRIL